MIEITREQDELNRTVWKFWPKMSPYRVDIILEEYSTQARPTKRHKWRLVTHYTRLGGRGRYEYNRQSIKIGDVPIFPTDVVEEVMTRFMATVQIKRGDSDAQS